VELIEKRDFSPITTLTEIIELYTRNGRIFRERAAEIKQ
jgi:hypothetical protein